MKTKTNIKMPKVNKETIGKTGTALVAAGTIIKAGLELMKTFGGTKK